MSVWDSATKVTKWICKKCGFENKSVVRECSRCAHEPGAGHREGRAYAPPEE